MTNTKEISRLREAFYTNWRIRYPSIPVPTLREISDLDSDQDESAVNVIDESQALEYTQRLQNSVGILDDKILLLKNQIDRKLFLRAFYIQVNSLFNGSCVFKNLDFNVNFSEGVDGISDSSSKTNHSRSKLLKVEILKSENEVLKVEYCNQITQTDLDLDLEIGKVQVKEKSIQTTEHIHEASRSKSNFERSDLTQCLNEDTTCTNRIHLPNALNCDSSTRVNDFRPNVLNVSLTDGSGNKILSEKKVEQKFTDLNLNNQSINSDIDSGDVYSTVNKHQVFENGINFIGSRATISEGITDVSKHYGDLVQHYDNSMTLKQHKEMFGRKKGHLKKHEDEHSINRTLPRDRDNFLAVCSRSKAVNPDLKIDESSCSSPSLKRNFQMLKMTQGFDLVLDDGEEKKDDTLVSLSGSDKKISQLDNSTSINSNSKNSQNEDVENTVYEVTDSLSGAHEMMSDTTTHQNNQQLYKTNTSVENSRTMAMSTDSISENVTDNENIYGTIAEATCKRNSSTENTQRPENSFNSLNRVSSKRSGIPPPVPKKPPKPESFRKPKPISESGILNENINNSELTNINKPTKESQETHTEGKKLSTFSVDSNRERLVSEPEVNKTEMKIEKSNREEELQRGSSLISEIKEFGETDSSISDTLTTTLHSTNEPLRSQFFDDPHNTTDRRSSVENLVSNLHTSVISLDASLFKTSDKECLTTGNISVKNENNESSSPIDEGSNYNRTESSDTIVDSSERCVDIDLDSDSAGKNFTHSTNFERSDTLVEKSENNNEPKSRLSSDDEVNNALDILDQAFSSENLDSMENVQYKSRHRSSSTPSYENWTINKALTSSIKRDFTSVRSSEDEEEATNDEGVMVTSLDGASPYLQRYSLPPTGSKDSGLYEDVVSNDSTLERDLAKGKVRNIKQFQQKFENQEEEETKMDETCQPETDVDSVSLASDIVFVQGDIRRKSRFSDTQNDYVNMEEIDTTSLTSTCSADDDDDDDDDDDEDEDSSFEEADSARDGMLNMRQLLVRGVLESEKTYLDILTTLLHYYKRILVEAGKTSEPVISDTDINNIFSNLDDIYKIHHQFVHSLEPKVNHWTHDEVIGEIFKIPVLRFQVFGTYLTNYPLAVQTIRKCSSESQRFQDLAQKIVVSPSGNRKEVTTLEEALFKPVQRVQRNTLVLHDLLKCTPEDHPDYQGLQKALKLSQHNLEEFTEKIPETTTTEENRRLVKSSFLVELVNGVRKLRYMFLFSDILICTKRETSRNGKVSFDIKWFAHLNQLSCDTKFAYNDDTKHSKREEIDFVKTKIRTLKKKIRDEMNRYDDKDKHRSIMSFGGVSRNIEKLQKKIIQYEGELILASPKLPFKISLEGGKVYTMLMTTDYEREEWKEVIANLSKKCSRSESVHHLSAVAVQEFISSVKETPQVNKIGSVLVTKDEDVLNGTLNVTIHKMNGLTQECDSYCCLEMDNFGHFFMKARTNICQHSREPAWNEDFELELDGSQTLRILCFKKEAKQFGDTLLGRGALELSKQWLTGSFQEKIVSMNEISVVISVRHTPSEKTMQRTPSRTSAAVFGVKISSCARREGKTVPTIVTSCVQQVEKRGMYELGIYRVSGVTSDLQRIKKLFDKNVKAGAAALEDVDIHAVTGILKLYLRELPEPLFTEANYQQFVDTLQLQDEEAKAQCILSLLHRLPDINYYTIVYLLEHLVKVSKQVSQNKMSIHNLSTIFGPTLLAPAAKPSTDDPLVMMCKGAEQVMHQSSIINYMLGLVFSGKSLRKSAQSAQL